MDTTPEAKPLLRVVKGDPSDEELAALVAVVSAVAAAQVTPEPKPVPQWSAPGRAHRTPLAAERGYIDAVIQPHETRGEIVRALRLLRSKRETLPPKKHGNIPL